MNDKAPSELELSSSFLQSAFAVLREEKRPLSPKAITDIAIANGYLELPFGGRTPSQTMKSKLSVHIRRYGERSLFVRTAPGRFFLREFLSDPTMAYNSLPFRAGPPDERVLVFDQATLDAVGRFQGISTNVAPYYGAIAQSGACSSSDRMVAEGTESVKQVLTYILVRDMASGVVCFDRGQINRVDDSLRGLSCVGFGGHVQSAVPSLFDSDSIALYQSAAKELTEELYMSPDSVRRIIANPVAELDLVAVINDDSSANGRRHFAFVFEHSTKDQRVLDRPRGREKSINRVRWMSAGSAPSESFHRFEFWSQLCLREFAPDIVEASPDYRIRRGGVLRRADVVCLVGEIGSGKTEAAAVLRDEFGFGDVNSGEVVAELVGVPPVPRTARAEFQEYAEAFIKHPTGPERLGKALAARIAQSPGRVMVDGIRHGATLDALKAELGPRRLGLIYVHSPVDIAFEMFREREDPDMSIEGFVQRRGASVEREVTQLVDRADAALYNWIGHAGYLEAVRSLGRELFL